MTPSAAESTSEREEFLKLFYAGINIENILYGVELLLYYKTMRTLQRNRGTHKKSGLFYALFSSTMLFLITIWIVTQAIFGQNMWLLDANFPGGPSAYWRKNIAVWYMDWGTTAIVVLQLMTDALMIYRCRIVWNSYRVVAVPIVLWVVTFSLGVSVDRMSSSPGGDYFTGVSALLSLSYWSIAVFLNTILTCMICYRVVRHGWRMQKNFGDEYATLYFAIATIVVESVLPYTLSSIAFLVSFGLGSPISAVLICVYFMTMCISPQILILRMVSGKALEHDTSTRRGSTMEFAHSSSDKSGLQWSDDKSVKVDLRTLSSTHLPDGHGKARALTEV